MTTNSTSPAEENLSAEELSEMMDSGELIEVDVAYGDDDAESSDTRTQTVESLSVHSSGGSPTLPPQHTVERQFSFWSSPASPDSDCSPASPDYSPASPDPPQYPPPGCYVVSACPK
ncbi:hypothetical protein QR680_000482 [Steinernema hermaphroditum]|uniref:Uncharacterized protein n=1 Tax=Steinernema hermaphroditum TaxID=289476 RepID=A0AA39GXJ1_9BILA|nr:hypothetical protein QR680_000482 [Steinernema hermaphroditum]